ncbi:MAG: hypothetical protein L3J73_00970, partial [Thermoplasmata archaeon]|nr:hypothetical protein [Thermoplasmata archaeon]
VAQCEVTILGGAGGSVTPVGAQWVPLGGTVVMTAAGSASHTFQSWTGTGSGSYTGSEAAVTLTVGGPITEQAAFAAAPGVGGGFDATTAAEIALGLVAAGLAVGIVLGRRRRARSSRTGGSRSARPTRQRAGSDRRPGALGPPER